MTDKEQTHAQRLRTMTPLLVIASFVSLVEVVAGLALTKAAGEVQLILTWFVVGFPIAVALAFFLILWNRPYVLYGPTEYSGGADVGSYVGAMKPAAPPVAGSPIAATIEENRTVTALVSAATPDVAELPSQLPPEDWFVLWRKKEYDKAVVRIIEAAEKEGLDIGIAHAIAGRMMMDKDRAEGIAYYEKTFTDHPTESEPYLWLSYAYVATGDFSKALATLDRGLSAGAERLSLLVSKAKILGKQGNLQEGLQLLRQEDRSGTNAQVLLGIAELLDESGTPSDALKAFQAVIEVDGSNEAALFRLAQLLADTPDKAKALPLYKRLLSQKPDNPAYHGYLGNLYLLLDLPNKAMQSYDKANELAGGKESWILANIGNLFKNQGLHYTGLSFLRKAVELNPSSTYAQDRLASALKGLDEEQEEEVDILSKLKTVPEQPGRPAPLRLGGAT